eukprot:3253160-Pyramimonas_sp.AAC.6
MKFFWAVWVCPLTDDGDTQFTYGKVTSGTPRANLNVLQVPSIVVNMKGQRVVPNVQAYACADFKDHGGVCLQGGSWNAGHTSKASWPHRELQ